MSFCLNEGIRVLAVQIEKAKVVKPGAQMYLSRRTRKEQPLEYIYARGYELEEREKGKISTPQMHTPE